MKQIEIHLTEEETKMLDKIASDNGISRKNLCETEIRKLVNTRLNPLLEYIENSYVLIYWPESQDFMEEEWFNKEAILSENSSYFIPVKRLL